MLYRKSILERVSQATNMPLELLQARIRISRVNINGRYINDTHSYRVTPVCFPEEYAKQSKDFISGYS